MLTLAINKHYLEALLHLLFMLQRSDLMRPDDPNFCIKFAFYHQNGILMAAGIPDIAHLSFYLPYGDNSVCYIRRETRSLVEDADIEPWMTPENCLRLGKEGSTERKMFCNHAAITSRHIVFTPDQMHNVYDACQRHAILRVDTLDANLAARLECFDNVVFCEVGECRASDPALQQLFDNKVDPLLVGGRSIDMRFKILPSPVSNASPAICKPESLEERMYSLLAHARKLQVGSTVKIRFAHTQPVPHRTVAVEAPTHRSSSPDILFASFIRQLAHVSAPTASRT